MLILIVGGMALLPTSPWIGLGCCAAGYAVHRVAAADEAQFMAFVLMMAGLGLMLESFEGLLTYGP